MAKKKKNSKSPKSLLVIGLIVACVYLAMQLEGGERDSSSRPDVASETYGDLLDVRTNPALEGNLPQI